MSKQRQFPRKVRGVLLRSFFSGGLWVRLMRCFWSVGQAISYFTVNQCFKTKMLVFIDILFTFDWNTFFTAYVTVLFKVARYSFSGSIPPKFEHKLRRHKQSFGKIATTVVLDEDENLLWSGLQRHRSCHSNEMTLLPILLAAVYIGTGNCSSKIIHGSFFLQ